MKRITAMTWWNEMDYENQFFTIIKNKEVVLGYPNRNPNSLTGSEIEKLYITNLSKESSSPIAQSINNGNVDTFLKNQLR